jgi:hypothetical protein
LQQTDLGGLVYGSIAIFLGAIVCMVGTLVLGSGLSDFKHQQGPHRLPAGVVLRVIAGAALVAAGIAAVVLKPF